MIAERLTVVLTDQSVSLPEEVLPASGGVEEVGRVYEPHVAVLRSKGRVQKYLLCNLVDFSIKV